VRNFGLDLARAVAIVLVVASHYGGNAVDSLGVLGVELFFVLSGFLIGGILLKTLESSSGLGLRQILGFWLRRWFRTLPNYYLFGLVYLVLHIVDGYGVPKQLWKYALFLQNVGSPPEFFVLSWSLAVEEWFYFIFPAVMLLLFWFLCSKRVAFAGAVSLIYVGSFVARVATEKYLHHGEWVRVLAPLRLDTIMVGVMLALLARKYAKAWRIVLSIWPAGFILVAGCSLVLMASTTKAASVIPNYLLYSIIPIGFAICLARLTNIKRPREWVATLVESLSKWSFSLYLCHNLLAMQLYKAIPNYAEFGLSSKIVIKCLCVGFDVLIASLVYRCFEKPVMDLRDRIPISQARQLRPSQHRPNHPKLQETHG
jgi:peptidoglycan/LPS O-acetylase OafA/YrhL